MTNFRKRMILNITFFSIIAVFTILIYNFNNISKYIIMTAYKDLFDKPQYNPASSQEINNYLKIYSNDLKKFVKNTYNLKTYLIQNDIRKGNMSSRIMQLRGINIDSKNIFPVFTEKNSEIFNNKDFYSFPLEFKYTNFYTIFEVMKLKIYDLISQKKYDEAALLYKKICFFVSVLSNTFEYPDYIIRNGQLVSVNILTENYIKKDFPQKLFLKITEDFKKNHIDYKEYHSRFTDIFNKHGLNIYNNQFEYFFNLYKADNSLKKAIILTPDTFYALKDLIFEPENKKISHILKSALKNPEKTEYTKSIRHTLLFQPIYLALKQYSYSQNSAFKLDITIAACEYLSGKTERPVDPLNGKELKVIKDNKTVRFISSGQNGTFEKETNAEKSGITNDDISVIFEL